MTAENTVSAAAQASVERIRKALAATTIPCSRICGVEECADVLPDPRYDGLRFVAEVRCNFCVGLWEFLPKG